MNVDDDVATTSDFFNSNSYFKSYLSLEVMSRSQECGRSFHRRAFFIYMHTNCNHILTLRFP